MNRKNFIKSLILVTCSIAIVALALLYFLFKQKVLLSAIITFTFVCVLLVIFYSLDVLQNEDNKTIEKALDVASKEALKIGNIGIMSYDSSYNINWMSTFFDTRNLNHLNEKILNWLPELQDMIEGNQTKMLITINEEKYEINKLNNASVLIFKDITNEYDYLQKLNDDACVLGLIAYDNYDEIEVSEDSLTYVNTNIKIPVMEYLRKFNCVYKTLKNNRLLVVLNEKIFEQILNDRFSILHVVRKAAKAEDIDVTLSMAFARGSNDLLELDQTVQELLELAQTRGGDQVVVRKIGQEVKFFGGNTEAREKTNKTKVRTMISAIKDLIEKSSNVIIVGHKMADADCIGSAICMSNIVQDLNKEAYIVCKDVDIDPMIDDVLDKYNDVLSAKHNFINNNQAKELLNNDTLVIMVDHHILEQSNAEELVSMARRIIVIDHHRRAADLAYCPLTIYIEASASSTCELVCEFLPYMSRRLDITEQEANIMYIGIMIDTTNFRVRTGVRTFDVAKQLRGFGANPTECDELSQDPYDMVISRSNIISSGKMYKPGVIIASVVEGINKRSIASQACDTMIKAKDIDCAFVIFNADKDQVAITARSQGNINVQLILEKMNGGGHMHAAGLQRKDTTVSKIENELLNVLDEYFKGDRQDESDSN